MRSVEFRASRGRILRIHRATSVEAKGAPVLKVGRSEETTPPWPTRTPPACRGIQAVGEKGLGCPASGAVHQRHRHPPRLGLPPAPLRRSLAGPLGCQGCHAGGQLRGAIPATCRSSSRGGPEILQVGTACNTDCGPAHGTESDARLYAASTRRRPGVTPQPLPSAWLVASLGPASSGTCRVPTAWSGSSPYAPPLRRRGAAERGGVERMWSRTGASRPARALTSSRESGSNSRPLTTSM